MDKTKKYLSYAGARQQWWRMNKKSTIHITLQQFHRLTRTPPLFKESRGLTIIK